MVTSRPVTRKIPLWKLVGGAAVHCVVPAYLLALVGDGWRFWAMSMGGAQAWLAHVPGISLWFLGAYGALGAGATGVAALVDGLARPGRDDPTDAQGGAADLRQALARGRGAFGLRADAALERIGAMHLDPTDSAVARMLRDLAAMVAAGCAVLEGEDSGQIRAITTEAIERIEQELARHGQAGAQEARDRVEAMAGYVARRYSQDEI